MVAIVVVVTNSPRGVQTHQKPARAHREARRIAPYWTVHPGDTLTIISHRTGLSVALLEARNPNTDPQSLLPGERLLLWRHPPKPRPKPLGPRFWTVRTGDSLGLIADKTGVNLAKLEQLNPRLKASALQPGERVRLRH